MKTIRFLCAVLALVLLTPGALALSKDPVLDASLSMLEEDNPFLIQYNMQTGSAVEARFPLGCPYFFGGSDYNAICKTKQAWQNSLYYKEGTTYVAGLDCVGFTRWVLKQSGRREHPSLSTLLSPYKSSDLFLPVTYGVPDNMVSQYLEPGDMLVLEHERGGYHVMIYIGTLRTFGWSEMGLPANLRAYVDYPLVIHCSSNEDYYDRYTGYVKEYKPWAQPTDGGVMVSLLNVPKGDTDGVMLNEDGSMYRYFSFFGYKLTVYQTEGVKNMQWVRWK